MGHLHVSHQHLDQAARFFYMHGTDPRSQQSLCDEWYNQFQLSKGTVDNERIFMALLQMVQRLYEMTKVDLAYKSLKEQLNKQILKALAIVKEPLYSVDIIRAVKELLKMWEDRQILPKQEVTQFLEALEPLRKDRRNLFAPPMYLINQAKNSTELKLRLAKLNETTQKLQNFNGTLAQYDLLLDAYQKAFESVQKYRHIVIKDTIDELKELDKLHYKNVIDLKYLAIRVDDLKERREKNLSQSIIV